MIDFDRESRHFKPMGVSMSQTVTNALGIALPYSGSSTGFFSATGSGPILYGTAGNDSMWGDGSVNVTMSGGNFSFVINHAFSPPAAAPIASAQTAAATGGMPASRQNFPKRIAHSPSSEPTDKSMPPVRTIGVMTSASSPISVLSLSTSNMFPVVAKFSPVLLKIIISINSTPANSVSNLSSLFIGQLSYENDK